MRIRPLAFLLGLLILILTVSGSPAAPLTPAAPGREPCLGIERYLLAESAIELTLLVDGGLMANAEDPASWSAAQYRVAAIAYEHAARDLQSLTPPPAATDAHAAWLAQFALLAEAYAAGAASGQAGYRPFVEKIAAISHTLTDTAIDLELTCDLPLYDDNDDGTVEIGSGDPARDRAIQDHLRQRRIGPLTATPEVKTQ